MYLFCAVIPCWAWSPEREPNEDNNLKQDVLQALSVTRPTVSRQWRKGNWGTNVNHGKPSTGPHPFLITNGLIEKGWHQYLTRCSQRQQTSPRCCHLAIWTKHLCRLWFWPIPCNMWEHENMTSHTKPEVHNVSHCRQKTTELQTWVICTDILVTFDIWTCDFWDMQADIQTNKQTDKLANTQTRWSLYFARLPGMKWQLSGYFVAACLYAYNAVGIITCMVSALCQFSFSRFSKTPTYRRPTYTGQFFL